MAESIFIIAEAGVNHNGDRDLAFELVDVAVEAGADAVKFQTFKADNLVTKYAKKAAYQVKLTSKKETQYEMLKRLELQYDIHIELSQYCSQKQIEFLSTAFDFESLEFLVNEIGVNKLKIPSGEITNGPFLLEHSKSNCDLIVSTGMATIAEVEEALGVIAFGLTGGQNPSRKFFQNAYRSKAGQQALREKVTLLHCTTEYPASVDDVNLRAISTMKTTFGLNVGYSDHSDGLAVPVAAAAMGSTLIEKHFTTDRDLEGPDHKASLNGEQLKDMVQAIRTVERAMGNGIKLPAPSEIRNREAARKSIAAACDIEAGELFTEKNLTAMRPGIGVSPMNYWDLLNETCPRKYKSGDTI